MPKHIKNTTTGQTMEVFYAFDGEKVRTVAPQGERIYLGGMEYLAGAKQHYTHAEGRVTYEMEDGVEKSFIQYKIADHLGNLMVLFGDRDGDRHLNTETDVAAADDSNPNTPPTVQLEIVQRHFYYAYGMEMEGGWQHTPDLSSAYRYNGKELLEDLGMDLYEYGARHFDAVIGRFTGVDPICEKYYSVNVYNYAECEPIGHVDLWGLQKAKPKMQSITKPSDLVSTRMLNNIVQGTKTTLFAFWDKPVGEMLKTKGNDMERAGLMLRFGAPQVGSALAAVGEGGQWLGHAIVLSNEVAEKKVTGNSVTDVLIDLTFKLYGTKVTKEISKDKSLTAVKDHFINTFNILNEVAKSETAKEFKKSISETVQSAIDQILPPSDSANSNK